MRCEHHRGDNNLICKYPHRCRRSDGKKRIIVLTLNRLVANRAHVCSMFLFRVESDLIRTIGLSLWSEVCALIVRCRSTRNFSLIYFIQIGLTDQASGHRLRLIRKLAETLQKTQITFCELDLRDVSEENYNYKSIEVNIRYRQQAWLMLCAILIRTIHRIYPNWKWPIYLPWDKVFSIWMHLPI